MASKQKKTTMKKENRSHSAKSTAQKEQINKEKIEELTNKNEELQNKIRQYTEDNDILRDKVDNLTCKIIEHGKNKGFEVTENSDVSLETLIQLLDLIANGNKRQKKSPVEMRLEEVETRITHLNMELAKMVQLRLNIENGLEDIEYCQTLVDAQQKARFLLYETRGNKLFSCLEQEEDDNYDEKTLPPNLHVNIPVTMTMPPLDNPKELTEDFKIVNLEPPIKKLPGDTHLKNMDQDLKKYLIQNLSLYKGNGADWRMLAERVGIPLETVQQWRRWKLEYPAEYVFQSWSQSAGATMRMLHRHLISPQMKCILLAKRVSDFYLVE